MTVECMDHYIENGRCPTCGWFDPYECEHESVDTRDEADGVAFGGASHHEVSTCLNCGANLYMSEPDEDGQSHWEVDE